MAEGDKSNPAYALFDSFTQAETCKEVLGTFSELCRHLEVDPRDYKRFYGKLKERLNYWKAKAIWTKLDKRAAHNDYMEGQACAKNKCLVLGAGPCGLRTAVELALLGAQVVVLEKRDAFSRNNVLHLWPFTIHDLKELAAKKFYGKFCTGALDHISIRQLQLILLKVALLLGVEVHTGVEFKGLKEPSGNTGWKAQISPAGHPATDYQFDVFVSAGGGRFVPEGFQRKELRGKLAIGITANFINRHTSAEAQVPEISGVARIYNQKFFQELHTEMGIDLENIVYYKDATHYFVMTAKKKSLLNKGVIKKDFSDAEQLLASRNVCAEALMRYAYEAADFSTLGQLPDLEFARNHADQPDVAMFDFTCMHRAENASLVRERKGKRLLVALVGDCLVEPFWPLGTGIARGFLASFDTAWMVRSWGKGGAPLEVLAERESVYQLLSQTSPENTSKNYSNYSINPSTRYPNLKTKTTTTNQVQHLYDRGKPEDSRLSLNRTLKQTRHRHESGSGTLVDLRKWCEHNTRGYAGVKVKDLKESWRSGLALCALIHRFRPDLIDFGSLSKSNAAHNNQLAFDILQRELGIAPQMSGADMASCAQIDQLTMVLYLSQVHAALSKKPPVTDEISHLAPSKPISLNTARSAVSFLNKLKHNSLQRRKESLSADRERRSQKMKQQEEEEEAQPQVTPESPASPVSPGSPLSSEVCYFCNQRLYVLERESAEGKFFHRSCFTCHRCSATLRQGGYSYHQSSGKFYCELHSEDMESGHRDLSTHTQDGPTQPIKDASSGKEASEDRVNGQNGKDRLNGQNGTDGCAASLDTTVPEDPHPGGSRDPHPPPSSSSPTRSPAKQPPEDSSAGVATLVPVPAPRGAHSRQPQSPPTPKPRSIHLPPQPPTPSHASCPPGRRPDTVAEEDEEGEHEGEQGRQTPSSQPENGADNASAASSSSSSSSSRTKLKKLGMSDEERSQLSSLSYSQDSDSEPPASSSASASSSSSSKKRTDRGGGGVTEMTADGREDEEEEDEDEGRYWTTGQTPDGHHVREQRHRRCFRRRGEQAAAAGHPGSKQGGRVRSKFSPWNLSSPRLGRDHRLSVHVEPAGVMYVSGEDNGDDEEDDFYMFGDNMDFLEQQVPSDPLEAQRLELRKMRTLERRAKMSEIQRFHRAQSIQRRLEEIEVTFKDLEEKGVDLERALRKESDSSDSDLIEQWIELVQDKNALVSEESDLMVASRQLELEDKQSMLELELRRCMEISDGEKSTAEREAEERLIAEMVEVVDMRNSLVAFLEEKRLKELSEPPITNTLMEAKRLSQTPQVHWE